MRPRSPLQQLPQPGTYGQDGGHRAGALRRPRGPRHRRRLASRGVPRVRLAVSANAGAHRAARRGDRADPADVDGSPASYAGEHYRIANAHCEPRPDPIPPIMIGGHGGKNLLRAVARPGHWWNYGFREHELYAHKQQVLRAHCKQIGREYDSIVQVVRVGILIAETEREVERLRTAPGIRPMTDIQLAGTPAQVTETLQRIVRQGAHRLIVTFADAPRPDGTLLFAQTVLPWLEASRRRSSGHAGRREPTRCSESLRPRFFSP